jgi:hypothetical protein
MLPENGRAGTACEIRKFAFRAKPKRGAARFGSVRSGGDRTASPQRGSDEAEARDAHRPGGRLGDDPAL